MKKNIFCLAPFYHSHVDSAGDNRLCCLARNDLVEEEYLNDLKLDPIIFWNSDYIKNRRKQMLENKAPRECINCVNPNQIKITKDEVYGNLFQESFEKDSSFLNSDYSVKSTPSSIDYRTAICNLKCLMCDPSSSTSMNIHFKKNSEELKKLFNSDFYNENLMEKSHRTFQALEEFLQKGSVKYVYFAGGEPTMTQNHLGLLDQLLFQKTPLELLVYNTNLMATSDFVRKWKEKLLKFKYVGLMPSIDAVGELGEYLRMGFKQKNFDENLSILQEGNAPNIDITLDVTITSLGVFKLEDLARYAIEKKLKIRGRTTLDSIASFTSLGLLEIGIRKKLVQKFENFYSGLSIEEKKLVEQLKEALRLVLLVPDFSREELRKADETIQVYKKMYPEYPGYDEYLVKLKREI